MAVTIDRLLAGCGVIHSVFPSYEEEQTMRAVMADIPPDILAWRKRTGADRWDEMWEGVLHMPPAPNREHQEL